MERSEFESVPFAYSAEFEGFDSEEERRPVVARGRGSMPQRPRTAPRPTSGRRPPRPGPGAGRSLPVPCVCPAHGTEFIRWVQATLNQVEGAGLRIDGVMDPGTRAALRRFQSRQGLAVDGIAGPEVEQALRDARRAAGSPPAEPAAAPPENGETMVFETLEFEAPAAMPTLRSGSRGSTVSDLQRRLAGAGFSPGAIDGIFGSQTDAAVRSFQRARGLAVDGIVGPNTWGALLNAVPGTPSAPPGGPAPGGGYGAIRYGKGWDGSEGVADAAKAIAAAMGIPVTSEKRNLADTKRVGSTTASDHYTGNTSAFATDLGVSGTRGDQLAQAIAAKYGIPQSYIGTYKRHTIAVGDRRYSLQLLWKVDGHYNHVHLGIRRV